MQRNGLLVEYTDTDHLATTSDAQSSIHAASINRRYEHAERHLKKQYPLFWNLDPVDYDPAPDVPERRPRL